LVFLTPGREEDYISFLSVRKTPVTRLISPSIVVDPDDAVVTSTKIRSIVQRDRALHDKAQKGFVSWVRSYSKHQARSIFRLSAMDWTDVANAWGLLKLPSMPELKGWDGDRSLGLGIDIENLNYLDKAREKKRLENIISQHTGTNQSERHTTNAWSNQRAVKEVREARREKRKAKREHARKSQMTEQERQEAEELQRMIQEVRDKGEAERNEFAGFED